MSNTEMTDNGAFQVDGGAALEAGRELDARVAREVVGWLDVVTFKFDGGEYDKDDMETEAVGFPPHYDEGMREIWGADPVYRYSTDMSAALGMLGPMNARGWVLTLWQVRYGPPHWCATFTTIVGDLVRQSAETAPLAICRAALQALASAATSTRNAAVSGQEGGSTNAR